jgi:hypothetical protein
MGLHTLLDGGLCRTPGLWDWVQKRLEHLLKQHRSMYPLGWQLSACTSQVVKYPRKYCLLAYKVLSDKLPTRLRHVTADTRRRGTTTSTASLNHVSTSHLRPHPPPLSPHSPPPLRSGVAIASAQPSTAVTLIGLVALNQSRLQYPRSTARLTCINQLPYLAIHLSLPSQAL